MYSGNRQISMDLGKQNVLFLTWAMGVGGTESIILQLCEILKPQLNKIIVCSSGGISVTKLEEMGICHYMIPDITRKNPWTVLSTLFAVRRIVEKENITIIHSHHRMAALYARLAGRKNIVRIANAHNTFQNKRMLTRFVYKDTKMIAVGNQVKKNLTDFYGLADSQVAVIHNAVKPFSGLFKVVNELQEAKKQDYVLIGNVGRLTEQKGMKYFLGAIPLVKSQCVKAKFIIVGEGEERENLHQLTKKLGVEKDVVFLGYRPDVQNVMSQLDFLVLSSLWEGLPLAPIEAFSVGKTVIATAVDGTPEIVQDRVNGLLVEKENSEALSNAIVELYKDKELQSAYAENAKRRYKEEFSFEEMRERYLAYYMALGGSYLEQICYTGDSLT